MEIFVLCIDPERGQHLAFGKNDDEGHIIKAVSFLSGQEAVGILVSENYPVHISTIFTVTGQ